METSAPAQNVFSAPKGRRKPLGKLSASLLNSPNPVKNSKFHLKKVRSSKHSMKSFLCRLGWFGLGVKLEIGELQKLQACTAMAKFPLIVDDDGR